MTNPILEGMIRTSYDGPSRHDCHANLGPVSLTTRYRDGALETRYCVHAKDLQDAVGQLSDYLISGYLESTRARLSISVEPEEFVDEVRYGPL